MAPTDQKKTSKKFTAKDGNVKRSKNVPQKKRKWVQQYKAFEGSIKEGQGFAFKKKEKVRHEYNKLLRKEKRNKKTPESRQLYAEEYPEHLKHLYLAEAEKLKKEAWTNRVNRSKQRMRWQRSDAAEEEEEEEEEDAAEAQQTKAAEEEVTGGSELADSVSGSQEPEPEPEPAEATARESLPVSNRMKKKMEKKTSFQKTKEEFERMKEKRKKKKEEYLKNKQQREEAIQKYKQRKTETFQMLSKKTKKGQPNLNLQMEYLLQKIQKN